MRSVLYFFLEYKISIKCIRLLEMKVIVFSNLLDLASLVCALFLLLLREVIEEAGLADAIRCAGTHGEDSTLGKWFSVSVELLKSAEGL